MDCLFEGLSMYYWAWEAPASPVSSPAPRERHMEYISQTDIFPWRAYKTLLFSVNHIFLIFFFNCLLVCNSQERGKGQLLPMASQRGMRRSCKFQLISVIHFTTEGYTYCKVQRIQGEDKIILACKDLRCSH